MNITDTTPTESNLSGLDRKDFQKNINSRKTDLYILKNAQGMEVAVTNYGCAILSIMVPDKLWRRSCSHNGARQKRKICQCHFRT